MSKGAFSSAHDAFSDFLWQRARQREPGQLREEGGFVGRNFLLDEGVPPKRAESYGAPSPASFADWKTHHDIYLRDNVFPLPPDEGRPSVFDSDEPDLCPETFRLPARSPYSHSLPTLHLLRFEEAGFLSKTLGRPVPEIIALAQAALGQPEGSKAYEDFDALLQGWQKALQLRPVYAAYWEDMADLFGAEPAQDQKDWAEQMRDRLGLAHIDPGTRGEQDVLVFRYAVAEVPGIRQWPGTLPLLPPTVLDGTFSAAFCPAPAECATGHVVHLDGKDKPLRREVLHPPMDFRAKHLWRVGKVTTAVKLDELPIARGIHLHALREARPDYAEDTDGDLL